MASESNSIELSHCLSVVVPGHCEEIEMPKYLRGMF